MKTHFALAAVFAVGLVLPGCSLLGGSGGTSAQPLNDVVTFTKADLDAAETNAVQLCNADATAPACIVVPCPPAIEKWVDATAGQVGQLQVKGLFSGAVAGEAVVNGVQQGIPNYVFTACGPAYMKLHADLYKLIGKSALLGIGG